MTTPADGTDGVRHAAETLRAARDELPAAAEEVDGTIRDGVERVVGQLPPGLHETVHEIRLLGTRMTADREDAFAAVSHVLTEHADQIEALLRAADVDVAPPPVPPPVVETTAADTEAVQLPDKDAHRRAINQIVARFPPKLQELAKKLLFGPSAHAVQRHGHHLRREHQIARAQWRLDPAGVDSWRLEPDGSVVSRRSDGKPHQVRATAGQYTSPEAFAKPLIALLQTAGRTQDALDEYLDDKADGDTMITIFLRPSDTGIVAGDVRAVRGPGTDTAPGEALWLSARDGSMAGHGSPPWVRDHDLVSDGLRPGSVIIFARKPPKPWRLVTGYFLDDHANKISYTEL